MGNIVQIIVLALAVHLVTGDQHFDPDHGSQLSSQRVHASIQELKQQIASLTAQQQEDKRELVEVIEKQRKSIMALETQAVETTAVHQQQLVDITESNLQSISRLNKQLADTSKQQRECSVQLKIFDDITSNQQEAILQLKQTTEEQNGSIEELKRQVIELTETLLVENGSNEKVQSGRRSSTFAPSESNIIAFTAVHNVEDISYVSGDVIPFPNIQLNLGNAYSSDTSTFTCPVKGVYYFSIHMRIREAGRVQLAGNNMAADSAEYRSPSLSLSSTYDCDAGEGIDVTAARNTLVHGQAGDPAIFTGFLLHQLAGSSMDIKRSASMHQQLQDTIPDEYEQNLRDRKTLRDIESDLAHVKETHQASITQIRDDVLRLKDARRMYEDSRSACTHAMTKASAVVVFSAMHNDEDTEYQEGNVVMFPNVRLNQGDAYNGATSTFTCPVNGTYYFATHMRVHDGGSILMAGVTSGASASEDHPSMSASTTYTCKAGEGISVSATYSMTTFRKEPASFSGFLISAQGQTSDGKENLVPFDIQLAAERRSNQESSEHLTAGLADQQQVFTQLKHELDDVTTKNKEIHPQGQGYQNE